MPTYKLLKTTLGGYEVFNLTSAIMASFFLKEDLSAQVPVVLPGPLIQFTTAQPYVSGTLDVFLDGVLQDGVSGPFVSESNPAAGEFTLDLAALPPGAILVVRYVQA